MLIGSHKYDGVKKSHSRCCCTICLEIDTTSLFAMATICLGLWPVSLSIAAIDRNEVQLFTKINWSPITRKNIDPQIIYQNFCFMHGPTTERSHCPRQCTEKVRQSFMSPSGALRSTLLLFSLVLYKPKPENATSSLTSSACCTMLAM